MARKLSFAFESRLSAVEDRAASILKDSKSLKAQIQDFKISVTSVLIHTLQLYMYFWSRISIFEKETTKNV
jgi:hypothetical protein